MLLRKTNLRRANPFQVYNPRLRPQKRAIKSTKMMKVEENQVAISAENVFGKHCNYLKQDEMQTSRREITVLETVISPNICCLLNIEQGKIMQFICFN